MSCETTSGGVTTAATMNAPTITNERISRSFSTETMPVITRTTTITGTSNVTPKAMNIPRTKLK